VRTTTRTNAVLYLLCAAALSVSIIANAQVVDGDLTYWRYEDTPEVVDTMGLGRFDDGSIVAVGADYTSVFDGDGWSILGAAEEQGFVAMIAQGPDGKVWFRTCPSYQTYTNGYWDREGLHISQQFSGSWATDSWLIAIDAWRGKHYLFFTWTPSYYAGVYAYCDPSCDDMRCVARVYAPPWPYGDERIPEPQCISGDYLMVYSSWVVRLIRIPSWQIWDIDRSDLWSVGWCIPAGEHDYSWVNCRETPSQAPGLLQLDCKRWEAISVPWLEGVSIDCLALDWRGLWVLGSDTETDPAFMVALWSFQTQDPDVVRSLSKEVGTSGSSGSPNRLALPSMTVTEGGALWFATDKAVVKWTPDPELIPMPYEARVEARATEDRTVQVEIEFDNLRIIRNDAMLHLKAEYLREGEDEPIPLQDHISVYHEFQPQETFRYSFEYVQFVLPSMDRIRYSVYTTYIDVNAPPTDEEIVTSNVATAEVRLD